MQKALILALLIGAFLLPRYVTAQDISPPLTCPDGGTPLPAVGGCGQVAPEVSCQIKSMDGRINNDVVVYRGSSIQEYKAVLSSSDRTYEPYTCPGLPTSQTSRKTTTDASFSCSEAPYGTTTFQKPYSVTEDRIIHQRFGTPCQTSDTPSQSVYNYTMNYRLEWSEEVQCPEEFPIGPIQYDDGQLIGSYCYYVPADEPTDPPECDIGDCNPPEEPKCFRGGNGQLVCFEDPNDKCDVQTVNEEPVYSNCEIGCGFVQGNFLCSEEPDIPSLDNCLVTTNGYACPVDIPEPDDTIDNPEKPIDNMVKGDFKDVLKGVETRTDATNKLISDQIALDAENTEKLAVGLGKANQYLAAIDKNTKEIADGMEDLKGDGSSADLGTGAQFKAEIQNALGITGDETIEDLTVAEVSLDDFTDDFQWSLGPDQCPQPRAINMLGKTFYMDWGPFCEAFTVLGYLILAAAYFFATLIAFRGK